MTKTIIKTRVSNARLKLAAADTGMALAQNQQKSPKQTLVGVMQCRAEALQRLDTIIAKGEVSVVELRAILSLLEGFAFRLLEDAVGFALHEYRGGGQDFSGTFSTLRRVARELRDPLTQYQPGRRAPVPYRALP